LLLAALWCGATASAAAEVDAGRPILVDDCESSAAWKPVPADGVEMKLSNDRGAHGKSLRVDFEFVKGGGYAVLHRDVVLDLPENYRFSFRLRGECPPENLEFKLIDSTGANVWWLNRRNVEYPREWTLQNIKQRQISFAWGPAGGGEIRHVAAIEFAITAGSGGKGTVWIDDLMLTPLPPPDAAPPPIVAHASSKRVGYDVANAVDGDTTTVWASATRDRFPWIELDLGQPREFGGLTIDWAKALHARDYIVQISFDHKIWLDVRTVRNSDGGRDYLRLPESEARWIRILVRRAFALEHVGIREITVHTIEWGSTLEKFYESIAKESPRGSYPRGISGEQSYWTVLGTPDGDHEKALLNEDGAIEAGPRKWSIEPFLRVNGRLLTWADRDSATTGGSPRFVPGTHRAAFANAPIHGWVETVVTRDSRLLSPAARGIARDAPKVIATYTLIHGGSPIDAPRPEPVELVLAFRPFQVNPPPQFLNTPGGVGRIESIAYSDRLVKVDGRSVFSFESPAEFAASTFDEGDVVDILRAGRAPPHREAVRDSQGLASGVLVYRFEMKGGAREQVRLVFSMRERGAAAPPPVSREDETATRDRIRFGPVDRGVEPGRPPTPSDSALDSVWPSLDYVLTLRDGAALHPGARSYERAWIRDGALMSSALLRLGQNHAVHDFIEWYAPYQYADGKVPCCVDQRGSDPVPEHDSHGEFIYLVAEYHRYTSDRALVERLWPRVLAAANAIDSLRRERRTPEWRKGDRLKFYGLLPPSISHEGYSAKPMHSYWDDLFALRGLKDATYLAGVLGKEPERRRLAAVRDEFQRDLVASIAQAMKDHKIDFIPGCADLGDYDATSTTIAFDPVQADDVLPRAALERTFEGYWTFFKDRRDGKKDWEAYTPYELRTVGAFVRLGWRDRASELLEFFLQGQRPRAWRQWPEVVWKDARAPHFLGDLPHGWVASDYLRSALDMLAYRRERDDALVVAAGIPLSWIRTDAFEVRALPTPAGRLGYVVSLRDGKTEVRLDAGIEVPRGGIAVAPPGSGRLRHATVNGKAAAVTSAGEVVVRAVPATVVVWP
jgi:hypothetical protein